MNTTTKILLAATGTVALGAYAYRRGIDALQFSIAGYQMANDGKLLMQIQVVNPNKFFGYPVPRMLVNVYGAGGSFIGTVVNQQLQYIPANATSFVYGIVSPNYGNFLTIIANLLQQPGLINNGSGLDGIEFHGTIQVGRFEIPFETGTSVTATS